MEQPITDDRRQDLVTPQGGPGCSCKGQAETGDGDAPSFVYAIGRVEPRFPNLSVERELTQVIGRTDTSGMTDRGALHAALSNPRNRYLARRMCWVLMIEGIETYLLQARDPADLDLLVAAIRPAPHLTDVDVILGHRGPLAPPQMCNGLMVPIVAVEQLYSFDVDDLIRAIPRPDAVSAETFKASAEEVFFRVMQLGDNAGAIDDHRALNYLLVRYPGVYAIAHDLHQKSFSLSGVEVRPSRLSSLRKVVDVVFSYTNRQTDVMEKYFARVDVTGEFPFLVTKLSPFFER
jgi:hypothetical protein